MSDPAPQPPRSLLVATMDWLQPVLDPLSRGPFLSSSSPSAADVSYNEVMLQPIGQATVEQINSALDLHTSSRRQGRRQRGMDVPKPFFLSHPDWQDRQTREQLKRVLIAVAKWNEALGYRESFAGFCAMVLAMGESRHQAFATVVQVYTRYQLEDYYQSTDTSQLSAGSAEQDAMAVWAELSYLAPEVTQAFGEHEEEGLFISLVSDWLMSLFTAGFSARPNDALACTPVLRRIIGAEGSGWEHPRTLLRHIAACVLMRSAKDLPLAGGSDGAAFREAILRLRTNIQVDEALLDLIDLGPSSCRCQAWEVAAMLPGAGVAGWLVGSVCGAALAAPSAAACGALGSLAGGALAVGWGVESGSDAFKRVVRHFASDGIA